MGQVKVATLGILMETFMSQETFPLMEISFLLTPIAPKISMSLMTNTLCRALSWRLTRTVESPQAVGLMTAEWLALLAVPEATGLALC